MQSVISTILVRDQGGQCSYRSTQCTEYNEYKGQKVRNNFFLQPTFGPVGPIFLKPVTIPSEDIPGSYPVHLGVFFKEILHKLSCHSPLSGLPVQFHLCLRSYLQCRPFEEASKLQYSNNPYISPNESLFGLKPGWGNLI